MGLPQPNSDGFTMAWAIAAIAQVTNTETGWEH
jgi:hypothetical protein